MIITLIWAEPGVSLGSESCSFYGKDHCIPDLRSMKKVKEYCRHFVIDLWLWALVVAFLLVWMWYFCAWTRLVFNSVLFFTLFPSDHFHPVFLQPPASCFHTDTFCLGASEDALEAAPLFTYLFKPEHTFFSVAHALGWLFFSVFPLKAVCCSKCRLCTYCFTDEVTFYCPSWQTGLRAWLWWPQMRN